MNISEVMINKEIIKKFARWCSDKENKNILVSDPGLSKESTPVGDYLEYLCIEGSQLYGTDTEDSDFDIKGVFIIPTKYFLLINNPVKHFVSKKTIVIKNIKIDYHLYELKTYLQQFLSSNINIFNQIFSSLSIQRLDSPFNIEYMQSLAKKSISSQLIRALLGMARTNYTKKKNQDLNDPKMNLVILRCLLESKYILKYKEIEMFFPKLLRTVKITDKDKYFFARFLDNKRRKERVSKQLAQEFKRWIDIAEEDVRNIRREQVDNKELPEHIPKRIKQEVSEYLYNIRIREISNPY